MQTFYQGIIRHGAFLNKMVFIKWCESLIPYLLLLYFRCKIKSLLQCSYGFSCKPLIIQLTEFDLKLIDCTVYTFQVM